MAKECGGSQNGAGSVYGGNASNNLGAAYGPLTPAVPLTNVGAYNGTGQTVSVTISGGTLTSVKLSFNGATPVQVGTTAGTYAVPDSTAISITYSVQPTWTWSFTPFFVQGAPTKDLINV